MCDEFAARRLDVGDGEEHCPCRTRCSRREVYAKLDRAAGAGRRELDQLVGVAAVHFILKRCFPPASSPGAASASPRPAPPPYTALHNTGNPCECVLGREQIHRQLACWPPASTSHPAHRR